MKINYKISYPTNLFYVVDNLSGWAVQSRPSVKELYPEYYELIKNDLKLYKKIRKNHGWYSDFQKMFSTQSMKTVYTKMKKDKELKQLIPIFKKIDKQYSKKWKQQKIILKGCAEQLKMNLKPEVFDLLEEFFDLKKPKQVNVYLCFSKTNGGNAMFKKIINLEVGGINQPPYRNLTVLIHELMHNFEKQNKTTTREWFKERGIEKKFADFLEEAMFDCVAPNGILTFELGIVKKPKKLMNINKIKFISEHYKNRYITKRSLLPYVEKYWKNKKKRKYKDFLKEILREYEKGNIKVKPSLGK